MMIGLLSSVSQAQQPFDVTVTPVTINGAPAIHSFAFGTYDGKWLFIGGRTNGLHGFLPPFGFPSNGINDSVFIVDPIANQTWSASLSTLPGNLYEALTTSNMEYNQRDTMLYLVGGYGYKSSVNDYITFSKLTAINIKGLMNAVINGNGLNSYFRQISNSHLAVTGGEMERIDSTFFLVFGHKFDGRYDRSDTTGFFTQEYSNQIRTFQINDDGTSLSISGYSAITDTANFHRRDFNLVPQVFANQILGLTAFSGVFQYGINLPYLNSIDITTSNYTVNNLFNQNLSQYSSAHMPVFDSISQAMHTVFFGGISMYYIDSTTQMLAVDSLVPFVKTISRVTRFNNGTLLENKLNAEMPLLLGTNAKFILKPAIKNNHEIIDLNDLSGNTVVGYIIGGISSPDPNISETDPALSSASPLIFKVRINKNVSGINEQVVSEPVQILAGPNPFKGKTTFKLLSRTSEKTILDLYDMHGVKIKTLFSGIVNGETKVTWITRGLAPGIYFYEIQQGRYRKTNKLILTN